ncbi:ribulokinase [Paenibacillus sp. TCA20]|uniref:ribulokinase n=1 Tax=Paenibacillus sp. TCA20 TaxID=1499968 RepID=UPI0004D4C3B1|nr:ribulokinase [Paenibacillus sp. TCA20]GAK38706.1 ribulokinase [Paenibacillus sp. TCA20]
MSEKYTIGIDFGTESGRAVLVKLSDGSEAAAHVTPYRHGVIDERLPVSGHKLELDWALHHPADYMEVLMTSVPAVVQAAGIGKEDVIGIGIDFTACTMLPIDPIGQPLCLRPELANHPHSWVKLWKHHAAQNEAERINETAAARGEVFLKRYGGKSSSEWMIAKVWQILNEAPDIYELTDRFVEAGDWVIMQLCGELKRSQCAAGYKAFYHHAEGYPDNDFFKSLDPRLEHVIETKLRGDILDQGSCAGGLSREMASAMGLAQGIAVAVGNVDAHAAVPAVGVVSPGKLVMTMGTSICHLLLGEEELEVEGICGVVQNGIIPGYFGYEAGQTAVGDIFAWFVENGVPSEVKEQAEEEGLTIHEWLENKASLYKPGETGLLALDWWNGNRSTLVDANLTGLIIGYTLQTKPEELYRTLLEATAFGTRKIIDAFQRGGLNVDIVYACGGLPQKNKLLMQIYADIIGREIKVAASTQTAALGAAMFAAVAAGADAGGYDCIEDAAARMARVRDETFKPIPEHSMVYEKIYAEYNRLHDYFGHDPHSVMKKLKSLKEAAAGQTVRV